MSAQEATNLSPYGRLIAELQRLLSAIRAHHTGEAPIGCGSRRVAADIIVCKAKALISDAQENAIAQHGDFTIVQILREMEQVGAKIFDKTLREQMSNPPRFFLGSPTGRTKCKCDSAWWQFNNMAARKLLVPFLMGSHRSFAPRWLRIALWTYAEWTIRGFSKISDFRPDFENSVELEFCPKCRVAFDADPAAFAQDGGPSRIEREGVIEEVEMENGG